MWNSICYASTEEDYEHEVRTLCLKFSNHPALQYVETTWLNEWKKHFVAAWTNQLLHLGHVTSSRVESRHSMLKRLLSSSMGDLLQVFERFHLALTQQQNNIEVQWNNEKLRRLSNLPAVFKDVVKKVTKYALIKSYYKFKAQNEDVACTRVFTTTMGLPCPHRLKTLIASQQYLTMEDFNVHWWIVQRVDAGMPKHPSLLPFTDKLERIGREFAQCPPHRQMDVNARVDQIINLENPPIISNPLQIIPRGRPVGARKRKFDNSTRREPSAFEYDEETATSLSRRHCGKCHKVGHNARTCSFVGI